MFNISRSLNSDLVCSLTKNSFGSICESFGRVRAQVLNLSRYFSLSPNRILMTFFCAVKSGFNVDFGEPPQTVIPYVR